jgi:murein DD-endopeptidase MepM/ murein hydrolase activator NlpD
VGTFTKLRHKRSADFAGVGRGAIAMAAAALAIAAGSPARAESQATAPSRYDAASRTLFVGTAEPAPVAEAFAQVTVSRAADIVGRPLVLVRPLWNRTTTPGGLRWLGPASMPSSMPLASAVLTSSFGMRAHPLLGGWRAHAGVDLAARLGSPIMATSDGMVARADWTGGYGLFVALDHGGGIQTRYGHMSRLAVSPGQTVHKGEVIGYVGSTGRSTGPHLHYEVRVNGQAVNPASTLRAR